MDYEVATQPSQGADAESLKGRLTYHIDASDCDELGAAAAYVTVAGVRDMLAALNGRPMRSTRWLVGLDDAVSQPGAIDLLRKLPNATVKVVAFAAKGARFHTKLTHLASGAAPEKAVIMVGSANLTRAALQLNAEAVAFLTSDSRKEAEYLRASFDRVWALGHLPSAAELEEYRKKYERAKIARKKLEKISGTISPTPKEILSTDEASIDPSLANTCWIECGSVTALGRELELKAEQGIFFGLNPTGGSAEIFEFEVSDGTVTNLRLKYQANSMWRLQLNASVPEVAVGLRPQIPGGGLGRSPYVAVFQRLPIASRFKLTFLLDKSTAYKRLIARSRNYGTLGQTTARKFGWC